MSSKSPHKTSALFISLGMGMTVVAIVALVIGFFLLQLPEPLIDHRIMMVAAAIIMFLIGFVLSTVVARKYGKPIEDLNERATRFVQGDYNVDFRLQNGPSEVVDLGESLQAITTSTRTAIAELHAEEQRQAQFVSDVSHEIRTPLTGIRGYAETLMQDDVPDDMRMHFLESIIRECSRLTRLANDLLDLQRIDAEADRPNWKRLNLREIVEDVHDTLEPLLEDREVALTIGGEAPDVLGNRDRLTQVLVNLIENASRFAESHVRVELAGVSGQSVITVSDDGPGFGDVDPTRLFDRFYRADKSRQSATGGAGLGLAIVKSIVTAHDGKVTAFNIPSGGACFLVAIPSIGPRD
ncbi:MAG: HAMP domain-containing sensor histidine kinase [Actinomycetota bacterium]|nr:HAMP domain-containing sensor histidine kinase [Actinomycetota bacterium]